MMKKLRQGKVVECSIRSVVMVSTFLSFLGIPPFILFESQAAGTSGEFLFDLGTATSPVYPGWTQVTSTTVYSATQGYGWDSTTGLSAIDQGVHNALDRDFVRGNVPRTFRVDVPNGIYEVWLLISDAIQDVPTINVMLGAQSFDIPWPWLMGDGSYRSAVTAVAGYPTTDYHWNVRVTNFHLDITFSSTAGIWQVNALAVRRQSNVYDDTYAYEVAVSNEHTAPAVTSLPIFTVPKRFWYTSNLLGDYNADWSYVIAWRDSITDNTMTPVEKMRAVAATIRKFLGPWASSNHPVDVLDAGNGSCTGVANLTTMVAWTLGLPARNLIIYADPGLDMPVYFGSDPYNHDLGSAHEISEVYLDGEWRTFDTGVEYMSFADFLATASRRGTIPRSHIYAARTVLYHGWDGISQWYSTYSPSSATLLYPNEPDHQYRLLTHDPRKPRVLRIDEAAFFSGPPVKIVPGVDTLRKTFWLSALRPDVQRIVTRIPFTRDYEGTPQVMDWYLKVNGHKHKLGKANTDWGANTGQMLEVEIPFNELVRGWNTLELGADTPNEGEGLWMNTSVQITNSQTTLFSGLSSSSWSNVVWFLDVEYSSSVDPGPPAAVMDLKVTDRLDDVVVLSWTLPGDDLDLGQATTYEIRYALSPINNSTWKDARVGVTDTYQQAAGNIYTARVGGLAPGTSYYFALKSHDEVGNVSLLSNTVLALTTGSPPPTPTPTATPTPTPILTSSLNWGVLGDTPVPENYDGDNKANIAVWRSHEGSWYILLDPPLVQLWGVPGDKPVPGDYDGDRKADFAVFRPSNQTWFILNSSGRPLMQKFGKPSDIPVPRDYDGDGIMDLAVYRPSLGGWGIKPSGRGNLIKRQWGQAGDIPVSADYDGDGKADIAVWRPGEGNWYMSLSSGGANVVQWGQAGDIPVPADYDGDGKADIAVWRPGEGNWYILFSSGRVGVIQLGLPDDTPIPADYDGDGKVDVAVWRPKDGIWSINFNVE